MKKFGICFRPVGISQRKEKTDDCPAAAANHHDEVEPGTGSSDEYPSCLFPKKSLSSRRKSFSSGFLKQVFVNISPRSKTLKKRSSIDAGEEISPAPTSSSFPSSGTSTSTSSTSTVTPTSDFARLPSNSLQKKPVKTNTTTVAAVFYKQDPTPFFILVLVVFTTVAFGKYLAVFLTCLVLYLFQMYIDVVAGVIDDGGD